MKDLSARKWTLLLAAGLLLATFTVYFGFAVAAGCASMSGDRAYYRGHFSRAWARYNRALRLGAPQGALEIDQTKMLLFALDQTSLGVKASLPMAPAEAVDTLRTLLASRIAEAPYLAYGWSLTSDYYLYRARENRRQGPLDLSTLSDDPVKNLLPEEGLAIAALREASRREPNNYIYPDLIAEQYIEWGMIEQAGEHVRDAVALYPVFNAHMYLQHPPIDPGLLRAAVEGYENALRGRSLIAKERIECDAGWLLSQQPSYAEAADFFRRAIQDAPAMADAQYGLGVVSYWLGEYGDAERALERAAVDLPQEAHLYYYLGLTRLKLGKKSEAIEALQTARELRPHFPQFFHTLGEVLESEGRKNDAERQYLAAANLNPESAEAWSALLAYYGRHPELHAEARRTCTRLAGTKIDPVVYKAACDSMMRGAR